MGCERAATRLSRRRIAKGKRLANPLLQLVPLASVAAPQVEALLDRAFGPDRHQRTAYRVRAGVAAAAAMSFALTPPDGALIGSIQCWPVAHHGDDGQTSPLVMVGPVAVDPAVQGAGHGQRLMRAALDAAAAGTGADGALMMIGDPGYYGRFFGFEARATGAWRLPGPVDPARLLARAVAGHGVPGAPGRIGPR